MPVLDTLTLLTGWLPNVLLVGGLVCLWVKRWRCHWTSGIAAGLAGVGAISTEQAREGTPASAGNRAEGIRTLQEVAQITSGRCFQAHDSRALFDVCRTIDRLERRPIESFQYRRYYEAYPWLGLAALMTLLTIHLLELTAWRRVPSRNVLL